LAPGDFLYVQLDYSSYCIKLQTIDNKTFSRNCKKNEEKENSLDMSGNCGEFLSYFSQVAWQAVIVVKYNSTKMDFQIWIFKNGFQNGFFDLRGTK